MQLAYINIQPQQIKLEEKYNYTKIEQQFNKDWTTVQ